ncbi:MAG: SDR family oxidoreductase [Desulfobacterales bacterium]|jgi:UDP-glucose 4-epimerase
MPFNNLCTLVTGGAGFIGSHLVAGLLERGATVKVIDNLTTGKMENLAPFGHRIEFIRGDIRDDDAVDAAVRGADLVFHQAAVVSVPLSVKDPGGSAEVNEIGTLKVMDAARRHGVKRMVLASSSAVYGSDPTLPKHEAMTPGFLSPYALQKLVNENYADLYHRLYGFETVCLRYFNVFGPRQDPSSPYSGVISIFMERATKGKAPVIFGDGEQSRDFIFVDDVVGANLAAAVASGSPGKTYNIGCGGSITVNNLWRRVAALAALNVSASYMPAREGDIRHSVADASRARDDLGFEPAVAFETGLKRTYDWFRSNAGA